MGKFTLAFLSMAFLTFLAGCATTSGPGKALAEEYYAIGNEWFDLKKFDKAALAYQKALSWNPELKIATVNWARTKGELGDPAGALKLLQPLLDADPENLIALQHQAWLTAKKDGVGSAADLYAQLASRLPGDGPTQYNAGLSLRAAGRDAEALAALRVWKRLDGKDPAGLTALAEILAKQKDPETPSAWLAVALTFPENDPKRFSPLSHWARSLEEAELFGEAVAAWESVLELPLPPEKAGARGEALFRRGALLLLEVEDYKKGSESVIQAWKAGYVDAKAWKALRQSPQLKFQTRLEADLKLAGVEP